MNWRLIHGVTLPLPKTEKLLDVSCCALGETITYFHVFAFYCWFGAGTHNVLVSGWTSFFLTDQDLLSIIIFRNQQIVNSVH